MRVLILGAGYLGREIGRMLESAGHEVVAVSRSGEEGALACDVSVREQVAGLPLCDAMVHCAASGRGGEDAYRAVYRNGCRNLVECFPGVPLVFTSSTSVYGQVDGSVVDEGSPAEPGRETGRLLREAEEIVLRAGGAVARLAGIYGPGRSVIMKKFRDGTAVIEEDGRRYLNQIHRDDAAAAVVRMIEERLTGVYCVADSRPLTQRECYAALAEKFGKPLPPSGPRDLGRKRGWTHKQVSNTKLRATGWDPRYPCFLDAVDDVLPTL
jgi:nucleoside-diphosphate-sugar epimerase